jgi:hypothetical protein
MDSFTKEGILEYSFKNMFKKPITPNNLKILYDLAEDKYNNLQNNFLIYEQYSKKII